MAYSALSFWTVIALRSYFTQRFSLAYSLSSAGRATGMALLPILAERFTEIYGWRGSLFLIAAINFHMFISALLTKTPDDVGVCGGFRICCKRGKPRGKIAKHRLMPKSRRELNRRARQTEGLMVEMELTSFDSGNNQPRKTCQDVSDGLSMDRSKKSRGPSEVVATRSGAFCNGSYDEREAVQWTGHRETNNSIETDEISEHICSSESRLECDGDEEFTPRVTQMENSVINQETNEYNSTMERIVGNIISSFREYPVLIPFAAARLLFGMISTGAIVFLVPTAVDKGLSISVATYLSSLFGIGDFLGSLLIGIFISKSKINSIKANICSTLISVVTFVVYPLTRRFNFLAAIAFSNGFFLGVDGSLGAIIMNDTLPEELFKFGTGLLFMAFGIGAPLGGLLAGMNVVVILFVDIKYVSPFQNIHIFLANEC